MANDGQGESRERLCGCIDGASSACSVLIRGQIKIAGEERDACLQLDGVIHGIFEQQFDLPIEDVAFASAAELQRA